MRGSKIVSVGVLVGMLTAAPSFVHADYRFSSYRAHPPIHIFKTTGAKPLGLTPSLIKKLYHLPDDGGHGTIAIIGAYDDTTIEKDLADFSAQFGLPACTVSSGCLEKHLIAKKTSSNGGWALETTLDVEWAHAIAPRAKILLVEASTPSGPHLLQAVDYAAQRAGVVAISMSWGGAEFSGETALDDHLTSVSGASFFASSGDNGTGASWPAASPRVIAVGGTSLTLASDDSLKSETAWQGSGGGISAYETAPAFQKGFSISKAGGMRAIPDVAYDADPSSGFPIVRKGVWRTVGGTSAGAPQWAAIAALGSNVDSAHLYADKQSAKSSAYFRDIKSGLNGDCGYVCTAHASWDYVTGLGAPLTADF